MDGKVAPDVVVIAAVADNRIIGANGTTPWHLPDDLRHFGALTRGHSVIMGRRTRDTLRSPLPLRQNIVLSCGKTYREAGFLVAHSLPEALELATWPPPIFIIGGERPYAEAMETIASTLYITEVHAEFDGDTYFPEVDPAIWLREETQSTTRANPQNLAFEFVTYRRRAPAGLDGQKIPTGGAE